MKTKQVKEDQDKGIDDEVIEPKTRARKKASDAIDEDRNKTSHDEPKTSKESKRILNKPKAIVKKKPLGIRKTLRSKKVAIAKEKAKRAIKQTVTRARKAAIKSEPDNSQEKDTVQLIPASDIKKEPVDDTPNSRSSSPKTAGRRQRLSSDLIMMKTMLGDSPSSLVLGPRTSPYSMRSERSNSPSLFEGKNLRSGKPRKVKSNLLNEVVMKEQKKRRRLLSDSKTADAADPGEDCKKMKRGRSCSRDGSEISKCSENTESDLSLSEPLNDTDSSKELNKNLEKSKTDLDVDIENNVQISTLQKVPSINDKSSENKQDAESSSIVNKSHKKKLSLKRSPSLDSDNNNSNRIKLAHVDVSDIENKLLMKTDDDTLLKNRSSILSCMSKTFNSREMSKNIRKARRGRKAAAASRPDPNKVCISNTITNNTNEDKQETLESLSKEIDDLINNLDQNINRDHELATETPADNSTDVMQVKQVSKFYGAPKQLNNEENVIVSTSNTPVKRTDVCIENSNESTPSKIDDSETIRLHYEEDPVEKTLDASRHEITYKCTSVASIDKLMDRLKEFEEFDKRRHRQESETTVTDGKPMMVTNDVVLIPKSGADIKPLKDIQAVRSPEKPIEKENVLSCFENNSAISIVKRDQVRKSIDIDLPNSVTLIKRNSLTTRKESISSNHSRESDAISIFEKSLGKDVTLTEIRKSVDKSVSTQVDLHLFATLHPNNPTHNLVGGVVLDANEISITPRVINESKLVINDKQNIPKVKSSEPLSRKSSESTNEEDKTVIIEKIKSPTHQNISQAISIISTPVAVKSPESLPMETEALPPPIENIKPEDISLSSGVSKCGTIKDTVRSEITVTNEYIKTKTSLSDENIAEILNMEDKLEDNAMDINNKENTQIEVEMKAKITKQSRSARCSIKSLPETDSIAVVECKVNNKQESKIIESVSQKDLVDISTEKISNTKIEEIQAQRRNSCSNTETKPKEYALRNYVSESKPDIPNEVDGRPARKSKSAKSTETQQEPSTPTDDIKKRKEFVLRQLGMLGKDENKDSTRTSTSGDLTNNVKEDKYNDLEKNHKEIVPPSMIKGDKILNDNEVKPSKSPKITRMDSQPGPSNVFNETPETKKHKEYVLRTLGLLTHKAAKEAKIEKLKEKERIYGANLTGMIKSKAAKSGSGDYTGTLKTVIKLNRGTGDRDKKKQRSSLKMTFQKSKYRSGKPTPEIGDAANEDEAYYTIERREGVTGAASDGGHRKSHYSNRLTNHDAEAVPEPTEPKETLNLVIPEKASSFSIHPGRLCMDQCFYCGGKFGLFDTPCHIAQIKSSERQKKILDNEEKLTIDSCLCDACYRHVDRRANCPSYRKRPQGRHVDAPPLPSLTALPSPTSTAAELDFKVATYGQTNISKSWQTEKPVSPTLDEESEEEPPAPAVVSGRMATCHTEGCMGAADYSIRRKWLIKMRSSVNKVLKLKCDYPGLHTIPLCGDHYRTLAPLMACVLCRRRITKHHNVHFIHHGYLELNPLLCGAGVPVQFSERPVVCNACRNYCTLLQRLGHNHQSARAYRRKLLQIYNIEVPPESDNEGEENMTQEEAAASKQKKKQRAKSKQRKSTEPEQTSESSEKTNESTPEKEKNDDNDLKDAMRDEEDIESLISSNKILVPGATKTNEPMMHSDGSEAENVCEYDTPFIHIDKQTELQYLLQKQNNPAQFLQKPPNLSQKHRNIMKIQAVAGVQKPAQIHRIIDKNAKRIHKIGQIITQKPQDKVIRHELEEERSREGVPILKNINLNDECTIETIPNKRSADINTLRNKWQMSESFTQVKKNLSELSKKFPEKESKKGSDAKYSNPVKRLETNPSISVRELFPGEEEMNLQCNIEFNNVKGVTPEGWEKCNTMIQYDVETKKLWTELQRPYGNQSSFLRHLILLEKYFRSGDLILSHNASPHAVNYSDSVQSRLRSYDNIPDPPRRNDPPISLIEFRKKPSMNGKSLLKSNQNDKEKDPKKFMPPPMVPKPKAVKEKSKPKPLPPELIAINTPNAQGRKAIQNVLHNIQQLVKGVSASDPTEVAAAPLVPPKYDPPKEKKEAVKTDTPKKTKPTSKPWRPTLMPITPENLAKIAREPTQVAVDGRNLPSLVQVMSSGKRYHITLQDYNKMCIMRREKLQQLQDSDKKRHSTEEGTVVTEIQPSAMLGNGGTVLQNITEDKQRDVDLGQMGNAATILKNVGLKNITIAPIPAKTATVTSSTMASSTTVTTPSLLVTTPIKIPQLGPAVSITSETILNPNVSVVSSQMVMPKIPKSLTVIPQSVATVATVASVAQPAPTTATTTQSLLTTADGTRP